MDSEHNVLVVGSGAISTALLDEFNKKSIKVDQLKCSRTPKNGEFHLPLSLDEVDRLQDWIKGRGPFTLVIYSVGRSAADTGEIESTEQYSRLMHDNFFSITSFVDHILPSVSGTPPVFILNSIASVKHFEGPSISYHIAKQAVASYVQLNSRRVFKSLGMPLISVNLGNVLASGTVWDAKLKADRKNTEELIKQVVPTGEFIKPIDIVNLVLDLNDSGAKKMLGASINFDNGQING